MIIYHTGSRWLQYIILHLDLSLSSKLEHSNYAGLLLNIIKYKCLVFSSLIMQVSNSTSFYEYECSLLLNIL